MKGRQENTRSVLTCVHLLCSFDDADDMTIMMMMIGDLLWLSFENDIELFFVKESPCIMHWMFFRFVLSHFLLLLLLLLFLTYVSDDY